MSSANPANMTLVVVLAVTGISFMVHHTYRFDRWRCLVPRRKEWFRILLTYMLIFSFLGLQIWAGGWCYIKYQTGWTILPPPYGAVPIPPQLWQQKFKDLNLPLNFWLSFAYGLQVSLNAEEGLYWYHLMRAVRRPKSAKSWLSSWFFVSWIVISILTMISLYTVTWINMTDFYTQAARMFLVGACWEIVIVSASTIVIWQFPAFLRDVRSSGAGPEVRSRLHFYHEANKVRTFFRFAFSICTMVLGIDGVTKERRINSNHIASDILSQIAYCSFFMSNIVSITLYLPRSWSGSASASGQVMVGGRSHLRPDHELASNALMSLLREGGQWDEVDDVLLKGRKRQSAKAFDDVLQKGGDEPFEPQGHAALKNWSSPFAIQTEEELPKQIRIRVEQEIHNDVDSMHSSERNV